MGYPVKISQYWGDVPLAHKIKKVIPYFLDIFLPFFPVKINKAEGCNEYSSFQDRLRD